MSAPVPAGVYVEDDADDEPTIWLHNPSEPDRPMALLCPGNLGRRGRGLLWEYIVRDLPKGPPTCSEPACDGELHYTGRKHPETNEDLEAGPCPARAATS